MNLQKNTYRQQSDLAIYCRTNNLAESLDVRKDRVHHYRRLVYNVVDDSLRSAFPLLNNLLSPKHWDLLVKEFFANHACQSTKIWQMPQEFYHYVTSQKSEIKKKYPLIDDLMKFEWTEVELFMMEDKEYPLFKYDGDWLLNVFVINPEYQLLSLTYPVHIKNAKYITASDKGSYFLLAFREKETGKVQFINISAIYTVIIENIAQEITLVDILRAIKKQLNLNSMDTMVQQIIPFLDKLKEKGFILGFKVD